MPQAPAVHPAVAAAVCIRDWFRNSGFGEEPASLRLASVLETMLSYWLLTKYPQDVRHVRVRVVDGDRLEVVITFRPTVRVLPVILE